jgi:thiamine biosynthesis lipoprotein
MRRDLFRAMGTTIDVTAATVSAIAETRRLFRLVEDACSRFLPSSELSAMNASPDEIVTLSPLMVRVMTAAVQARTLTDGLVDAGIGDAVRSWGYDGTFETIVDRPGSEPPVPGRRAAWRLEEATLVRDAGVCIDLGGIAKGWTSDLAVDEGPASIVSAGGDVRSAARDARVEIVDPWGDVAATVHVGVGALATSSVARRRWRIGERGANHLIDPRTMEPTQSPILQASAITATALEAEAAAKAILLLGAEGLAWADRQPWIRAALVVWHDGNVYATSGLEMAA